MALNSLNLQKKHNTRPSDCYFVSWKCQTTKKSSINLYISPQTIIERPPWDKIMQPPSRTGNVRWWSLGSISCHRKWHRGRGTGDVPGGQFEPPFSAGFIFLSHGLGDLYTFAPEVAWIRPASGVKGAAGHQAGLECLCGQQSEGYVCLLWWPEEHLLFQNQWCYN